MKEQKESRYTSLPKAFKIRREECKALGQLDLGEGWHLEPCVGSGWFESEKRLLIVLESVDGRDIKQHRLMTFGDDASSANPMATFMPILLYEAYRALKLYPEFKDLSLEEFPFKVSYLNWGDAKSYHLKGNTRAALESRFDERAKKAIKLLKPTHVLVCGDRAAQGLVPHENPFAKRGWVFDQDGVLYTPTLDVFDLYSSNDDDEDEDATTRDEASKADLLYFVQRNLTNLLAGRHLHSLKHVKPKPVYIDTVERFDKMLSILEAHEGLIGLDTETANLYSKRNHLYTIQFADSDKRGFVVPLWHPKTPFNEEDLTYIRSKLRKFLGRSSNLKTFITFNGTFDLRILRTRLDLPVIHHTIHEIQAGENLLDENIRLLKETGSKRGMYGLMNCLTHYDNDYYHTAAFSKSERDSIGMKDVSDPDVLAYCAMDAQSVYALAIQQLKRAECSLILQQGKLRRYLPFFLTHLYNQMSDSVKALSHLEENGSTVDVDYIKSLLQADSPLRQMLRDIMLEARSSEHIAEVNKKLTPGSGLFGAPPFVFSFTKSDHKHALFFDEMGLEAVGKTKSGALAIDKHFIAAYQERYEEVRLFGDFQMVTKLLGTYVKGWLKKIFSHEDSSLDNALRASYSFIRVVTGRLASFGPNLQQTPSRGKLASIIQRMFIAPKGELSVRADYSAHEVRMWGNSADDASLCASFLAGLELRKQLIVAAKGEARDAIREELKTKGDVHIMNIHRVFNKWVDKSHPWRDLIKSTIFGLIYGMAVRTLGLDTKAKTIRAGKSELSALKAKIRAAESKKEDSQELRRTFKAKAEELQKAAARPDKEWVQDSEEMMKKLFAEFKDAAKWLEVQKASVEKHYQVSSRLGRRRMLYRALTEIPALVASAHRCGMNSPIQGCSSELGTRAAQLALMNCYRFIRENKLPIEYLPKYTRTVHDANYFQVKYEFLIPFLWIFQHTKMYGVTQKTEEDYAWKFQVPLDVEIELSAREDEGYSWDWTLESLRTSIEKALKDQHAMGRVDDVQEALDVILAPARDASLFAKLQGEYPLLNVAKLPKSILEELVHE